MTIQNPANRPRALIAMSGGVDSSVAACLMQQAGYDCTGITMRLTHNETLGQSGFHTCCSEKDIEDAAEVAYAMDIPYEVLDFTADFREQIIEKFVRVYEAGGTPNPCIDCNKYMKFRHLLDWAEEHGMEYVVTGHYARVEQDAATGRWLLKKGLDEGKDQSYVLYNLTQEQLAHIRLPLGALHKTEVRKIAQEHSFINAQKHDSQDICFVPDGDYAKFIEKYTGKKTPEGDFVDKEGRGYGAAFNLKADASDILIPVSDLVPTKAAMLPQDWPGVNPYWYPASAQENNGIALDWKIIDFVQVSLREELYNIGNQKNKGVVVERIDLLFQ